MTARIGVPSGHRKLPSFRRNAIAHSIGRIIFNGGERGRTASPRASFGYAPRPEERGPEKEKRCG